MRRSIPTLLLPLVLAACGGGAAPNPNPNPNPTPVNQIRARIVACPLVNQSSDPTASACLAGTYTGKTLSGADCSLVVQANGNYTFTSPALSTTYVTSDRTIRVFGHQNVGGMHQVIWLIGDPIQSGDSYDLDFKYADGLGRTLEIEATKRPAAGGTLSSTCTAVLN
ncbi:hypothetical protein [uncultured Deinococcus sp.]|uniref:hypothetical protein n=1 Tax=uncultured Deinococcus sp. TaxID=158789 RepID=UPI0025E7C4E0|nr:hypothetical protein [uncultured Deinococcus sp.]